MIPNWKKTDTLIKKDSQIRNSYFIEEFFSFSIKK